MLLLPGHGVDKQGVKRDLLSVKRDLLSVILLPGHGVDKQGAHGARAPWSPSNVLFKNMEITADMTTCGNYY